MNLSFINVEVITPDYMVKCQELCRQAVTVDVHNSIIYLFLFEFVLILVMFISIRTKELEKYTHFISLLCLVMSVVLFIGVIALNKP